MPIGELSRGNTTATPLNVRYRIDRISPCLFGRWLDYGCADGGYVAEMLRRGASEVVGVDVEEQRIEDAKARQIPCATFFSFDGVDLPFASNSFDGVFMNEVLEHVVDERQSLAEAKRVIRPGGYLALISPNRWFPFEGHGVSLAGHSTARPTLLVPWLPDRLTRSWTEARNYWPHELVALVRETGFVIWHVGFIWPVFERYRWLPSSIARRYQRRIGVFHTLPLVRRFGVSTYILGVRAREKSDS